MTSTQQIPNYRVPADDDSYQAPLLELSEASVEQHFDAFVDIDWDAYEIDPHDPRFVLPALDIVGGHPWYQALSPQEQARVGGWPSSAPDRPGSSPPTSCCATPR